MTDKRERPNRPRQRALEYFGGPEAQSNGEPPNRAAKVALKAVFLLALVCVVTLSAAACGGGGSNESESTSGSGDSKISGEVTVWDTEYNTVPGYTKAINQIDAEFEKLHPGVTVNREAKPYDGYSTLLKAALVSKEGPDLMTMFPGAFGVLSFTKGLEVLNDRISPEMKEELFLWDNATAGYSEEGEHYGVPVGLNGEVFYYNKKLFAKAGLPTDFKPESWQDVIEAGELLEAAGIQPIVGGNKEGGENSGLFGQGMQTENSQSEIVELAEGDISYTDERIAKAFGPMIDMQNAGLYPSDRFSTTSEEGWSQFAEGEGAMVLGYWNSAGFWGEFNPALGESNVGMFLTPGSTAIGTFTSTVLSIPTFAQNKDAAWALIEFVTSKESTETLQKVGEVMPNRTDVEPLPNAPIQERELLREVKEGETVPAQFITQPVAIAPIMTSVVSELLQGRTSLQETQQALQEAVEKEESAG